MSVELSPHVQLGFPRPLTQLVKRTLTVSNPNNQPVAFKVKTTAPKQYCVRPNSGRIEPGEKVEVQVLLQPMKEEPPSSAKCRDKFLVQSTIITPDFETASLQEIWPQIEKENKSAIHEQKIRCAYLPATTAPLAEEDEGNQSQINGDDKYSTVRGSPNGDESYQSYNPIAAAQNASAKTDGSYPVKAKEALFAAGGAAAAGAGAAAVATKNAGASAVNGVTGGGSSTSSGGKDVSSLSQSELQAEVTKLRKELEKARGSSGNTQTASADGVPIHIVAGIAFAVFAITYVMF
ncbi:MSP domain protein [Kalmanozyma brasiliensis GHG001]|uniref:MSP domain-containing protein n=1 Tax=Kalmanozyma brasiliensis (strain GHG001) TaxID=1365824 RepID=V5ER37_KALBG|nr:MSP domain protein [Kalmanozyma brasiliensis GHG001]EST07575.1 MSP domain protein [Kalmanozyma brasiliensis GHG001]